MSSGEFSQQVIVLHEDHDLLVISKPPRLRAIPDGYDPDLPYLQSVLAPRYGALWMVHRLDKDTSGVMLVARTALAHRRLNEAFRTRLVEKIYHGLVSPAPAWHEKTITAPLQVNADRRHRTRVTRTGGKTAWTKCTVIKRFSGSALLTIEIRTGITHQIRAHLRAVDLSLLGDDLYQAGLPPQPITAERVMLHARKITFPHPATGERLTFTARYPDDFRNTYTKLRFTRDLDDWL